MQVMPAVRTHGIEYVDDDLAIEKGEEEDDRLIAAMEVLDFADGYQDLYVEDNNYIRYRIYTLNTQVLCKLNLIM